MNNRFIVAVFLVIAAAFSLLGYFQEKNAQYQTAMTEATTKYLGPSVQVVKITVHEDDMVIATYTKDGKTCESHIVKVRTAPQPGLFGTICK